VKFLCDVHISLRLVKWLNTQGFEATHVNKILDGYFTKDDLISAYAVRHGLILITKDADFKNQHLLRKTPKYLVKINSGNTSHKMLLELFQKHIELIHRLSEMPHFLLEIDQEKTNYLLLD
jgi:predicted nuclease of predicted toxin-antitoxin system